MSFPLYKLFAALIIFVMGIIGGLFPILSKSKQAQNHLLLYGEYLARGIFLGAGLIHLLPDAMENFNSVFPHAHYPYVTLICALTIFFLYLIEQGLTGWFKFKNTTEPNHLWLPYIIIILLSIHSVIEGAVLGVETTLTSFFIIAFAIIAHKAADAFALGINLPTERFNRIQLVKLVTIFALLTPIGMLVGEWLIKFLYASAGQIAQALFNAIAAGTFIYIATNAACSAHSHEHEPAEKTSVLFELAYFASGLILMAVVAIWV